MSLAETIVGRLVPVYAGAADPAKAAKMAGYLRDQFPFLGIQMAPRRVLSKQILVGLPRPAETDLRDVALACWRLPEREYQYFAVDWLTRHARVATPNSLPMLRELITTKSWWDTVDALAAHVVGGIVTGYPDTAAVMDDWARADNLWLARTAILHQLRRKDTTDADRLFGYCQALAGHQDFFIRKAIGWALRQYARTDPDAVGGFVAAHPELSPLSVREALKHV
jgi:3-methyladenine DNA glycosylase AlkD